jgi:ATP-dependent Clp protease protease subunit
MAKELYLYTRIDSWTAEVAVRELNKVSEDEDLIIRINTPGGTVNAGWSIISKLSERKSPITGMIDGDANSMGALALLFFDKVIANDTSRIMFHKAAYPSWHDPSESEQKTLKAINKKFREKLEAKVKGKKGAQEFLDKVFENDVRNDVELNSYEAKNLGIVDEVRILEPKAFDFGIQVCAIVEEKNTSKRGDLIKKQNEKTMDLTQLKTEHPHLYAQIIAEGEKIGVEKEKDRVGAWMAFVEIDAEAVVKGIKEDLKLTQTATAEFTAKAIANARTQDHNDDNVEETNTPKDGKSEEEIKAEAQEAEAQEALKKVGINIE